MLMVLAEVSGLTIVNLATILRFAVVIRSAAAMVRLAPVTIPPRATELALPVKSVVVRTRTPEDKAACGDPIVAPVRVMVMAPAATSAVVATVIAVGTVPPVVVAQLVPVAPGVTLM